MVANRETGGSGATEPILGDAPVMTPLDPETVKTPEPILVNGLKVSAAVGAIILLVRELGIPIDQGLEDAISAVIMLIVIPVVTWWIARQKTVPVAKANRAIVEAVAEPNDATLFAEGR